MRRAEFLKRAGAVVAVAYMAPKVLVEKVVASPVPVVSSSEVATSLRVVDASNVRIGDFLLHHGDGYREIIQVTRVDVGKNVMDGWRGPVELVAA